MSTLFLSRGLSIGIITLGLLCALGLAPGAAEADAASADNLQALVARDGWVLVRVGLASVRSAQGPAKATASAPESEAQDAAVQKLLLGLPENSYTDAERQRGGSTLIIRVDPAGLDALSASAEVVSIAPTTMPVAMRRVAAGGDHSLAVKTNGTLWAWGMNWYGQLGAGTTGLDYNFPVNVMRAVVAVEAGVSHSLAVKTNGTLWAWGDNGYGQIGDGTTRERARPVNVMSRVAAVAGGCYHSLALKTDGTLWAWGDNDHGQLGDGTARDRARPVSVLNAVAAIAAGCHHSLALKTDGSLWAWGFNEYGQLGDGTTRDRNRPVSVLKRAGAIAAGSHHSLAVKTNGSLWAWGINAYGQLGDGTTIDRTKPKSVLNRVAAISAGNRHTLALKTDGTLWAWGWNAMGQLGDGTTRDRAWPDYVRTKSGDVMHGVSAIAAGSSYGHSLALKTDETLWTWGWNFYGQLGDGTWASYRLSPVPVRRFDPLTP